MQPKAELIFINGERAGDTVALEQGRTVIGRQVGDLIVADKEVSSIHAIVSYERGGWYVMDLGSTNGVFVDEQVKLEARLRNNTELRVGETRLRFQLSGAPEEDSEAAPDLLEGGLNADLTLPHVPRGGTLTGDEAAMVRDSVERDAILRRDAEALLHADISFEDTGGAPAEPEEGEDGEPIRALGDGPGVMVSLEILEGADKGAIRRYNQESVLVGRLNTDLVVRDSDVSRRHSIIEVFDAQQVYLRDLNSTNGSYVNGKRVSSVRLRNGDQIRLGRCLIRFSARPV